MKAILMAAGVGSRISREIHKPKSVLEINNEPLIHRISAMLIHDGIEVAVVVGYQKEQIFDALKDLDIQFYYNPFYRTTNSMGSLWFARDFIDDKEDLLLANADVFWSEKILNMLHEDIHQITMVADASRCKEGDYFFKIDANRHLVAYGKELSTDDRDCEYIGVARLKAEFVPNFRFNLCQCVENEEYHLWWENVLYYHIQSAPVYVLDVKNNFWGEIDYIEDYNRILNYLRKEEGNKK